MILVTGATGLLGSAIVRELLARQAPVRVLCRKNSDRGAVEGLALEQCDGDLNDAASVRRAVAGCSAVIHSAAYIHIGWNHLDRSRAVNVEGTRTIATACHDQRCRLIQVSTVDTLPAARTAGEPIAEESFGLAKVPCSYVVSKTEAEKVVRDAIGDGLDAVIVNPGFMLGPYDWKPSSGRMMIEVARAPLLVAPGGGGSVCDVRDVARAIVETLQRGRTGQRYILAGENVTYQRLWEQMLVAIGKKKRVLCLPRIVSMAGHAIDFGNRLMRLTERSPNGAEIAMGGLMHFYDSGKAQRELDYRWRPLEETLRDAWQWLREHHAIK